MLNLSLSGCGFLGIYHIGVVSAFREHAPQIIKNKISGCSAGSLVAACALCDCCLGQMVSDVLEIALKARSYALGPLHPSFSIVEILRNGLRRILPVDAHKICNGRLFVSLTRWKDGKNVLVSEFDSREDLIQALICSSFVPCYSGFIPPKFKGVYFWDGGLSSNNPILDEHTIVVSPFGGESDICPREESASYYCFDLQGTNIQWSKENFYRLSKALFPPSPHVLKAICFRGYKDAVNFLKSRNLLHCSCQKIFREKSSLGSLMGEEMCNFPLFESDDEENGEDIIQEITSEDSDEDQIEQYAQSIEPLKYQEMPRPVIEILDAACEDHKENVISSIYNSQISRAISICFLPWTLPVEFGMNFTKRLVELIPKINVPHESQRYLDYILIYFNLIIQKLTHDKYQYHSRLRCKLCVLNAHQIDSKCGGLKFSLCYHGNNSNIQSTAHHNNLKSIENNNKNIMDDENKQIENFNPQQPPKLCARHRLPSVSMSENGAATSVKSMTTLSRRLTRRRFITDTNQITEDNDSDVNLVTQRRKRDTSLSSTLSCTTTETSMNDENKQRKFFSKTRSDRKLRRFTKLSRKLQAFNSVNMNLNQKLNENEVAQHQPQQQQQQQKQPVTFHLDSSNVNYEHKYRNLKSYSTLNVCEHETFQICDNCPSPKTNQTNNDKTSKKNDSSIDFDSYLEKFEMNILGSING